MTKSPQSPGSFLMLMLKKYNLNPFRLSKDIGLSQSAVRLITIDETKISVSVAMRLAKYFNTNPEFWLAMQMRWDVAEASKDKKLMSVVKGISKVKKETPVKKQAAAKKAAVKKPTAKKAVAKKAVKKTAVKTGKKPARGRPAKK